MVAVQGKLQGALKSLQYCITVNPVYVQGYNTLGCLQQELGLYTEAIGSLRRALEIRPNYNEARLNLGNLLRVNAHLDEAMRCYDAMFQYDGGHEEALAGKASILERQGKYAEAMACIKECIDENVDNYAIVLLAFAY